jgi:S1-C subfamily serine protease
MRFCQYYGYVNWPLERPRASIPNGSGNRMIASGRLGSTLGDATGKAISNSGSRANRRYPVIGRDRSSPDVRWPRASAAPILLPECARRMVVSEGTQDLLTQFSVAVAARAAAARPLVAAIRVRGHSWLSATLWRRDVIVASEQGLPRAEEAEVVLHDGRTVAARLGGRDPGTNIALLRFEGSSQPAWSLAVEPQPGAVVLALAADGMGGCAVRMGAIHSVGPAWHSRAGGRIDRRIGLDLRLGPSEEGGPVIDAAGGLVGISTLGPRRRVLVIPTATVERVLEPLLANGRIARGWLGLAVQPVLVPEALREPAGQGRGLMILGLTRDGPAAQAGVLMGDILVTIDGAAVDGASRLAELLGPEAVGKPVQLRLIRAGNVLSMTATVGERPSG